MTIVVVMALSAEARPVIERLGLLPVEGSTRMPWLRAHGSEDGRLAIVVNGRDPLHDVDAIGTDMAALTTMWAVDKFEPTWLVSAGTAGGFASQGGTVGQVIISDGPIIHHDRRVDLDGYRRFARGEYPTADLRDLAAELGFTPGPCSTGDSLDAPPPDVAAMDAHGTMAKDMEAATVAGIAARLHIPFTALKVITDIVDGPHPTPDEFLANLAHAGNVLADSLPRLVSRLH